MEELTSKKYFWILLDALVLGIIVNLVFFVMPAIRKYGDSLAPVRTISVSAEGKTTVSPDVAEVSFSVVSRGKNPEELTSENNEKISAAIQNLKAQGIDEKDIKTTGYNLSPNYTYDKNTGRNYIDGYTFNQTVRVKIRALAKTAKVIGGLTPLGVNQIGGISFVVDNPERFLAEARADALLKATAKAKEMAVQTGARLGNVMDVSEHGSTPPVPYMGGRAAAMDEMGVQAAPPPTIEPGSQEIKVQVSVTYALE